MAADPPDITPHNRDPSSWLDYSANLACQVGTPSQSASSDYVTNPAVEVTVQKDMR